MERIPWDQYFMGQSVLLSLRSTCTRLTVGATIVRDKRIIAGVTMVQSVAERIVLMKDVMLLIIIAFEQSTQK